MLTSFTATEIVTIDSSPDGFRDLNAKISLLDDDSVAFIGTKEDSGDFVQNVYQATVNDVEDLSGNGLIDDEFVYVNSVSSSNSAGQVATISFDSPTATSAIASFDTDENDTDPGNIFLADLSNTWVAVLGDAAINETTAVATAVDNTLPISGFHLIAAELDGSGSHSVPMSQETREVWELHGASPKISNNNFVMIREGSLHSGSVQLLEYDRQAGFDSTPIIIADELMGFTNLGAAPGMTSDASVVAFYGELSEDGAARQNVVNASLVDAPRKLTPGPGIFAAIDYFPTDGDHRRYITRVAGLAGNGYLDPGERWSLSGIDVGPDNDYDGAKDAEFAIGAFHEPHASVSVSLLGEGDQAAVVYTATDTEHGDASAIYWSRLNFWGQDAAASDYSAIGVEAYAQVARAGTRIGSLGNVIDFGIHNAVNSNANVAFHALDDDGDQALFVADWSSDGHFTTVTGNIFTVPTHLQEADGSIVHKPDSALVDNMLAAAPGGLRAVDANQLVIHATVGTERSTVNEFAGGALEVHYVVNREGRVTQMVLEDHSADHGGSFNANSVGIELVDDFDGSATTGHHQDPNWATEIQLQKAAMLSRDIARRHGMTISSPVVPGAIEAAGGVVIVQPLVVPPEVFVGTPGYDPLSGERLDGTAFDDPSDRLVPGPFQSPEYTYIADGSLQNGRYDDGYDTTATGLLGHSQLLNRSAGQAPDTGKMDPRIFDWGGFMTRVNEGLAVSVTAADAVHVSIVDPQGRRLGNDPSGDVFAGIPNAMHWGAGDAEQSISIADAVPGIYEVQVSSADGNATSYDLEFVTSGLDGSLATHSVSVTLDGGETSSFSLNLDNICGDHTTFDVEVSGGEARSGLEQAGRLLQDFVEQMEEVTKEQFGWESMLPWSDSSTSSMIDLEGLMLDLSDRLGELGSVQIGDNSTNYDLDGDTQFVFANDEIPPTVVTVPDNNRSSAAGLVGDINDALAAAGLAEVLTTQTSVEGGVEFNLLDEEGPDSFSISSLQGRTNDTPAYGQFPDGTEVSFSISRTGQTDPQVVSFVPATNDNAFLPDLVHDLNVGLNAQGVLDVFVYDDGGELVITGISPDILDVSVSSDTGEIEILTVDFALANIGLDALSGVGGLAFDSVGGLISVLETSLRELTGNLLPPDFDLDPIHNPATNVLEFNLAFNKEFTDSIDLEFSDGLDLAGLDLGPFQVAMASVSEASVSITADAQFRMGIYLGDLVNLNDGILGEGFSFDAATFLWTLNDFAGVDILAGMTAATPAPEDGQLGADVTFRLEISKLNPLLNSTRTLTLPYSSSVASVGSTNDNFNVASLVGDLNRLLTDEGLIADVEFQAIESNGDEYIQLVANPGSGINSLTLIDADALGFDISQSSDFSDLMVTLTDVTDVDAPTVTDTFDVSLDGAATVRDVIDILESAGAIDVDFNTDGTGFAVSAIAANTEVVIEQAETDGNRSLAGVGLGIAGVFPPGEADGNALHGKSLLDRVYIVPAAEGEANLALTANLNASVDASAAIGKLGFDLVTTTPLDVTVSAGASFVDTDSDGYLYLSEAFESLSSSLDLTGLIPAVQADGVLELRTAPGEQTNIFGESQEISDASSVFELRIEGDTSSGIRISANADAEDLVSEFKDICVGDVIIILTQLADSLKSNAALNVDLPGIGMSPLEMVEFADALLDVAAEFVVDIDIAALENAIDAITIAINNLSLDLEARAPLVEIGQLLAKLPSLDFDLNSNLVAHLRLLERQLESIEAGTLGLPSLQLAFDDLAALVPSWATFGPRLEAALEGALNARLGLPEGTLNFELDFLADIDTLPDSEQRAIVLGLGFDRSGAISHDIDPDLPSIELGPIELSLDAGLSLSAGANVSLGLGVTLDDSRTPFIITSDVDASDNILPTEIVLDGYVDGVISGDVQFGSLDLLTASGFLSFTAAEVEQGLTVGNDGSLQLAGVPKDSNKQFVLVFDNGMKVPTDDFEVDGNTLTNLPANRIVDVHYLADSSTGTPNPATFTIGLDGAGAPAFPNSIGATAIGVGDAISLDVAANGMFATGLSAELFGSSAEVVTMGISVDKLTMPQIDVNETALNDLFSNIDFDIKPIVGAFDALLEVLEDGIVDEVLGNLPVIGSGFNPDESFLGELRTFVGDLEAFLCDVEGSLEDVAEEVRLKLIELLGSGGLEILKSDESVTVILTEDNFEIGMEIGNTETHLLDFDLGIDSLPLDVQGQGGVEFSLEYGLNLQVGTDREEGLYFGVADGAGGTEVDFEIDAHLAVDTAHPQPVATSLTAQLFGLELSLTDNLNGPASGTYLDGTVLLDMADVNGNGRVYVSDLLSTPFAELFAPTFGLSGAADVQLAAGLGSTLPQIQTDLTAGFDVNVFVEDGRLEAEMSGLEFGFEDVGINLGDFLSKHAGVIVDKVNQFVEPIREPLEMLTQEILGVSDLSKAAGNGKATFLDLAFAKNPDMAKTAEKFLDTLVTIVDLADTLETLDDDNAIFVLMDDASLSEDQATGDAVVSQTGATHDPIEEQQGPLKALLQQLEDVGIYFHLLSDPTNAINMLLGQPFDVATFSLPTFQLPLDLSQKFPVIPIPPISVEVGFHADFIANLSVGYDSHGVTTGNFFDGFYFGDHAINDDGSFSTNEITEFELSISASLAALLDAVIASVGVEGRLQADVEADWRDLDDDNKVHLDEIESILNTDGIECIFDLSGSLNAIVAVVWEVLGAEGREDFASIELFSFSNTCPTFELGHVSDGGELLPGLPAGMDQSSEGTLILHAGAFADLRGPGKTSDTTEEFTVTQLAPGVIQVVGLGLESRYADVTEIYFDGGIGDDKLITVDVDVPVFAIGGPGADWLYGGAASDYLDGGSEDDFLFGHDSGGNDGSGDTLIGDDGDDHLWGNSGPDTIHGGDGNDVAFGGSGGDTIQGDHGDDVLYADEEGHDDTLDDDADDTIDGGLGDDEIWGLGGDDNLSGGGDDDFISGGSGNDILDGGPGDDVVLGDSGNDTEISGGSGNDFVSGGLGNDLIRGESGNDLLVGGLPLANDEQADLVIDVFPIVAEHLDVDLDDDGLPDNDYDHGEGGIPSTDDDVIEGGTGHDLLIGDEGADEQFGGWGNDAIIAHLINDQSSTVSEYIEGGPNNDFICGGNSDDEIYGGTTDRGYAILELTPGTENGGFSFGSQVTSCSDVEPSFSQQAIGLNSQVNGVLFDDANGNGTHDEDESTLSDWPVYLYDDTGQLAAEVTTNDEGEYVFDELSFATYTIAQATTWDGIPDLPAGYAQTFPSKQDPQTVSLSLFNNAESYDFGNQFTPAVIYGQKYHDLNADGTMDIGELGLNGWEILLMDELGNVLDSRITENHDPEGDNRNVQQGWYEFNDLEPGTYWIAEVPQPGWVQTSPALSSSDDNFQLILDDGYSATESVANLDGLSGKITDVDFWIELTHNEIEQLDVYLVSPAGTRINLFSNISTIESDLTLNFNEESLGVPVQEATDLTANLIAESPLVGLQDEDPNGTWTLYVQDEVRGTQGTLDYWYVRVTTDAGDLVTGVGGDIHYGAPEATRLHRVFATATPPHAWDFGNVRTGQVTGTKYLDEDGDGIGTQDLPADLDGDGDVDFADFLTLSSNFGQLDPTGDRGDIDGDGRVGFGDFLFLGGSFGKTISSDPVLPGVTIFADLNGNELLDNSEPSTITGVDGSYTLSELPIGEYSIREVVPPGFAPTFPDGGVHRGIQIESGTVLTEIDFANHPVGGIHGRKFEDLNANGQRDPGEPGLAGVGIYLDENNNGEYDLGEPTAVTMEDNPQTPLRELGHYWFDNVPNGTHVVREIVPNGFTQTAGGQMVVYETDFSLGADAVWSPSKTSEAPRTGNRLLGLFDNETVSLSLGQLPPHEQIQISFDLIVAGSWDGSHSTLGGDTFTATVDGVPFVDATFSNSRNTTATWSHPVNPFDVNNDQVVDRDDVTAVTRELRLSGERSLGRPVYSALFRPEVDDEVLFLDVNADGVLSTLDALAIEAYLRDSGADQVRVDQLASRDLFGQSYPASVNSNVVFPSATDAHAQNSLGYDPFDPGVELETPTVPGPDTIIADSTYRLTFILDHDRRDVQFEFTGSGLENIVGTEFEAWGIDNVVVGIPTDHHVVEVSNGTVRGIDFGNARPGEIHGTKWLDADGDGHFDDNEKGLPGVVIFIDENGNGVIDPDEPRTITMEEDESTDIREGGQYWFRNVPPGTHQVMEFVPESLGDFLPTFPVDGIHLVQVLSGKVRSDINFGNKPVGSEDMEYGDAPDSYQTTFANDGARHVFSTNVYLGSEVDFEIDGQPSAAALEDDREPFGAPDDEDGFQFAAAPMMPGTPFPFEVTASVPNGFLNVWVDFNGDGTFAQPNEHVITDATLPVGSSRMSFPVPPPAQLPQGQLRDITYLRARYSTDAGLSWFGPASDGEVEDYTIVTASAGNPDDPIGFPGAGSAIQAQTRTNQTANAIEESSSTSVVALADSAAADEDTSGVGTVTGVRWFDVNGNGRRNLSETGLAGVTVYSDLNNDGQWTPGEPFVREDSPPDMFYSLALEAGDHRLKAIPPVGYRQTFPTIPSHHEVDVMPDVVHTDNDFGFACEATVTGLKWLDANGNGFSDQEIGLANVEIYADLNANGVWDEGEPITTTGSDGQYSLCVPAGVNFMLRERVRNGWVQTAPDDGGYPLNLPERGLQSRLNFGNRPTNPELLGELSGRKWHDDNRNGVMDPGEKPLSGVAIYIDLNGDDRRGSGEPIVHTSGDNGLTPQDETGFYRFTGLPAGEYTIRELKPLGFEQTYPASGEHLVTLAPGEVSPGHDFGNRENDSQVEGFKWHDLNGDGKRDPGEPGLSGIHIYVDTNQNGQRDSGELRVFTRADNPDTADVDETGTFSLAGPNPITKLPPGIYHIREALNNQYTPTFPNADGLHVIELRPGETEYLEFGNKDAEQVTPGDIHGWKWHDANGNGVWDDGEKGIAGVQIFVDSNDNGIRDLGERRTFTMSDDPETTDVDETGMFWISNLLPGDYRVREVVPAGFVQTFPPAGFHDVILRNGETREGLLFGNREAEQPELGGIHGTKWVDWNGDGIWDSDEPGWAGVVIYLDANDNARRDDSEVWTVTMADNPETMELDETGMYWFDGLPAGNYVVREETPDDSYQTWPLEQQDYEWRVDLVPGQVATERDFGNWPDPEVSGTKWNDLDGDGAWDDNEPPMGDVRIYADLDDDGEWDQDSEPSTSTAGDGTYTLTGLPPGEYSIREVQRDGFVQTYPGNGWPIEVFPELSFDGLNFGNHEGFGGVIQGTKYDDRSGILGQRDADDVDWGASGYAPITIYIDRNNNGEFDEGERSVETNATGGYTFVGLESGTHIVREILEEGFAISEPAEGFYEVTVAAGQVIRGKDFGNFEYQAIEDGDDIVFAGAGEDRVWGDNLMADPRVLSEGTRSDELHGEDGPDILHGQEADDLIWGDSAFGTAYKDTLDGGDGDDRVLQSTDAATQLLSNSELTGQGPDTLVDSTIEHATLSGGDSANTLDASLFTLGAVELRGGAGDDQLIATDFDDILHGGDDADSLQAGLGNDELNGGNGDDAMSGDDGDDRYTFDTALSSESDTITESDLATGGIDTLDFSTLGSSDPVDIDLVAGIGSHTNRAFVFTNPQYLENVTGGDGDDIIRGSIANNVLIGGPGNDQLDGEAGDDLISGGLGVDSMQGGIDDDTFLFDTDPVAGELIEDEDGIDALDLSALSHHWQVDIDADQITFSDYLSAMPDVVLGSISFTTENSLERIVTGAGDERLNVRAGMAGGAGTFESGMGTDEIAFSSFGTPVTVSLLNEIATGFASVSGFENIIGSPFSDSLEGNASPNMIRTGGGVDTLAGLEGDDHYVLESAPDGTSTTVQVLELAGEGTDTLDLANSITGAVVDMDNAPNVEVVFGTPFDDTIIANASSILLDGGLGHDVYRFQELDAEVTIVESLASEGGSDWLDFFPFTTSVYVDLAESTHTLPNVAGTLTVHVVGADGLPTASIENVLGGLRGDVLIGNDGDNTLLGSNGDDQIYGKRGRDVLSGGIGTNDLYGGADDDIYQFDNSLPTLLSTNTLHEDTGVVGLGLLALGGRDTLDFSAFTTGVTFDLNLETNIVGNHTIRLHDGVPVYDESGVLLSESSAAPEHFEILLGSTTGANVLQGNAAQNLIVGGDEADDLQGRAGTDILLGMAGADLLVGGSERDVLVGGIGTDELNGGDHQDVLIGGSTQYESPLDRRALELLLQAWVEKVPYADRVQRLETVGVDDGEANYRFVLDETVFSDLETDVLSGGDRLDWFFGTGTEVTDIQPNEERADETS